MLRVFSSRFWMWVKYLWRFLSFIFVLAIPLDFGGLTVLVCKAHIKDPGNRGWIKPLTLASLAIWCPVSKFEVMLRWDNSPLGKAEAPKFSTQMSEPTISCRGFQRGPVWIPGNTCHRWRKCWCIAYSLTIRFLTWNTRKVRQCDDHFPNFKTTEPGFLMLTKNSPRPWPPGHPWKSWKVSSNRMSPDWILVYPWYPPKKRPWIMVDVLDDAICLGKPHDL